MSRTITIAYIFERYPVLTQTFLRREIAGLRGQGIEVEIYSMLPGESGTVAEKPRRCFGWWETVKLTYALPRELWRDPKLWRDGWRLARKYRFPNRENFWATLWAVIYAICEAPRFRQNRPDIFHGVRATGPATAAAILSRLCGVPFTFGAHAYDIYRDGGDAFLEPKLFEAEFVHTSTETGAAYLRQRFDGGAGRIVVARRGLESLPMCRERDAMQGLVRLLSVGRLMEKKGHGHQIAACALLKQKNILFEARIVGDGPLRARLEEEIQRAGMVNEIKLCGALPPEAIEAQYFWADIFWHTGVVDQDGDRDGLPNVIPEAMACGLPLISNCLPATMEALQDGVNGLAVDVTNAVELAEAVERLAGDAALQKKFGENGRRWVEENFLAARNVETLARAFQLVKRPSA